MPRPTLYIMLGYPGSGKTTTAKLIADLTGAIHVWADVERVRQFGRPTHHEEESLELYQRLNAEVESLLAQGFSVVFDTSFNHRSDRDLMREIARRQQADVRIIQLDTPLELAASRALSSDHADDNQHLDTMTPELFARVAGNLEPPMPDEEPLILDGTQITREYVAEKLSAGARPA